MQSDRRWSTGAQFRTYDDVEGRPHAWGRALHDRGLYGDKRPVALLPTHLKGFLLRQHLAPAHAQSHIVPYAHAHARLDHVLWPSACRSCKQPLPSVYELSKYYNRTGNLGGHAGILSGGSLARRRVELAEKHLPY